MSKVEDPKALKKALRKKLQTVSRKARLWWFYDYNLYVLETAMKRAPIRTGKLRASGWMTINGGVQVAKTNGEKAIATSQVLGKSNREAVVGLGFGGPRGNNLLYAKWVHEITWRKHKTGEAKFLANALMSFTGQALPGLQAVVAKALEEQLS